MTTADWALIISILSAVVSLAGFIWNVWSKFIYPKPVLRLYFSMMGFVGDGPWRDPFLNLSITNHGPTACTITHAQVEIAPQSGKRVARRGVINPLKNVSVDSQVTDGPFTNLPRKLEAGERFSLHFWAGENSFIEEEVIRVGVTDSFSREHWCAKKQVKSVQREFFQMRAAGTLAKLHHR